MMSNSAAELDGLICWLKEVRYAKDNLTLSKFTVFPGTKTIRCR